MQHQKIKMVMSKNSDSAIENKLYALTTQIISETNGITLNDTLELLLQADEVEKSQEILKVLTEFQTKLGQFQQDQIDIAELLSHPFAGALCRFFTEFPLNYREEHIHLTGSLDSSFIFPRLKALLNGPQKEVIYKKIQSIYGESAEEINSEEDVEKLILLKETDRFDVYLKKLLLPKLILTDRKAHQDAAYHLAETLHKKYNVGMIRLKFTFDRSTTDESEKIPGLDVLTSEEVVLGLYDGFKEYQKRVSRFQFILAPSFRKESAYYDSSKYPNKKAHFEAQVDEILRIVSTYPEIAPHLCEVDTVGNETNHYRKSHFNEMRVGLRRLQYKGFKIRSHHGEVWRTLRRGIQAVDNAMNIWHIDTLEHGLSLGINPNYYFHSLFQRLMRNNKRSEPIQPGTLDAQEVEEMEWGDNTEISKKLLAGQPLNEKETLKFMKAKFHTAREVEHYQHDVLNRMINKEVSLIALPSSNQRLTGYIKDFKDHPFSWWEKKGVSLGVGTDNYVTLNTNFVQEMLILLLTDPADLKITKLLMVTTGESRRPLISEYFWQMRKKLKDL